MPHPRQISESYPSTVSDTQEGIMIGGMVRIVVTVILGAGFLVAITVALGADLFAADTRPALPRVRLTARRRAMRSLMEVST